MTTTRKPIIFTDLDGTLLDRNTYSFEPAQPALQLVEERDIPLVLCSSKTRAEIEFYRKRLKNRHPFISENGGAVFVPKGYFSFPFVHDRETSEYLIVELGTLYPVIVAVLDSIKRETGIPIRGFSDLTEEDLISICGLSPAEAGFAKKREYDEPFVIEGGEREIEIIKKKIEERGMNYVWGGIFHHLMGGNDKGRAVASLKKLYEKEFHSISTIGLGESLNDLPMLFAVDRPIFFRGEGTRLTESLSLIQNLTIIDGTGPQTWNDIMLKIIG